MITIVLIILRGTGKQSIIKGKGENHMLFNEKERKHLNTARKLEGLSIFFLIAVILGIVGYVIVPEITALYTNILNVMP
jgi:hypothetical protein